jgi:hypothetical protein
MNGDGNDEGDDDRDEESRIEVAESGHQPTSTGSII